MMLNGGRILMKVPADPNVELVRKLLPTFKEVKEAAASNNSVLLIESESKGLSDKVVRKMMDIISNWAIKVNTTWAICKNQLVMNQYGELLPINNCKRVMFSYKDSTNAYVECNGLIKTADRVILLNIVKAFSKREDISDVLFRAANFENVVRNPSRFVSVPPLTAGILDGIKQVVPFLSRCAFPRGLAQDCQAFGINTVETIGSDCTVNMHSSPARH
jgi:hypothetical protein